MVSKKLRHHKDMVKDFLLEYVYKEKRTADGYKIISRMDFLFSELLFSLFVDVLHCTSF